MKKVSANQTVFLLFVVGISFLISGLFLNISFYKNKIYPRTSIDGIDVSGLTFPEAIEKLNQKGLKVKPHTLKISVDDIYVASSSSQLSSHKNYQETVNYIYSSTKQESQFKKALILIKSFFISNKVFTDLEYEEKQLDELVNKLKKEVEIEGKNPSISLKISGNENSIVIFKGLPGRSINTLGTKENIKKKINNKWEADNSDDIKDIIINVDATVASTSSVLSDEQVKIEVARAKSFVGKTLKLEAEDKKYELDDQDLVALIKPFGGYQEEDVDQIIEEWSEEVNRDSQNAEFEYDKETLSVSTFKPHKDGLKIDKTATKEVILSWLKNVERENLTQEENIENNNNSQDNSPLATPLRRTSPETTLESTNNLGIKERIGFGESYYHHSIINRVHNVGITAERVSLIIVPPGSEFSFNKALGEVSARTGFRSAYVISGGKTILGDGGGVCQVSSTLFRAVLDAGLKIVKRLQHSYRVSYYELNSQPGFDATVYSGEIDFRFTNDTQEHILVYSYVEPENRYMNIEIYGTNDGRTTEISNYKKWDFRGPPAAEYFPSADLATGVVKQVDWSVSGIKTEFTHIIRDKDGNVTNEESYYSNYRPWSAKYMVGI
jgi:vancomycin resistance protein YoaR